LALEICNNIITKQPFQSNMDDDTRRQTLNWIQDINKEIKLQVQSLWLLQEKVRKLEGMLRE